MQGQGEVKDAPFAQDRATTDGAAHGFGHFFGDGKAESTAGFATGGFGAEAGEFLEKPGLICFAKAGALILHGDLSEVVVDLERKGDGGVFG